MTKLNEKYLCNICGNFVQVLEFGSGQLVCCGEAMQLVKNSKK